MSAPVAAAPSFKSKVLGWLSKVASPSTTHASSMLLILGFLAASSSVNAESVVSSHHDDASGTVGGHPMDGSASSSDEPLGAEAKPIDRQELFYYMAMGMLVSQSLLRLLTWYQNRREAQAAAANAGARKKNDDLSPQGPSKEVLDFVTKELGSDDDDSDDDDYEESEEESSDEEEEEEEEEDEEEEDAEEEEESESESELERRRRLLAVGDAEVEE
ncbi:hypothetical protein DFQ26_000201 [Actinomortierella ambigua]|nr:hypothetical protein DFQ26_000201 [Actinomortierella ambigua]